MASRTHPRNRVLAAIAIFRFAKAVLLAVVGIAAFRLVNPRVASAATAWVDALPFATEHRVIGGTVMKVLSASRGRKELAAGVALAYASLFAVEGVGLWLEKLWAEYLTIVATASFIPFEIYEVAQRASAVRIAFLLSNLFIVGYLIRQVRGRRRA
jgi:uncharacterized membrane protein (DUF2068 family)